MTKNLRLALGAALLCLVAPCSAQTAVPPAGALRVEGDSTLHKWSCTTYEVSMTLALADGPPRALGETIKAARVKGVEVRIPVSSLQSGDSGLDKNMRRAMSAGRFPNVVYTLGHYELVRSSAAGVVTARTTGELTIAGRTKTIAMDVELRLGADKAEARGSYPLKMSDYGIKPPTLMLGTIKVRDPVTIRFDLFLKKPSERKPQK